MLSLESMGYLRTDVLKFCFLVGFKIRFSKDIEKGVRSIVQLGNISTNPAK